MDEIVTKLSTSRTSWLFWMSLRVGTVDPNGSEESSVVVGPLSAVPVFATREIFELAFAIIVAPRSKVFKEGPKVRLV